MSQHSPIQWCDSSLNLQMGCDGCELWNEKKKSCYAGVQIDGDGVRPGFKGQKGWPTSFGEPALFPHRLPPALKWKDLTGTDRPDKPWMNGLPRIIFLNDMGDTFSKKLPLEWMAEHLPAMAQSPHQFLVLTKRPSRAVEFSKQYPFPKNFWIGTSVTSDKTENRVEQLLQVQGGRLKFVSFEPLWSAINPKVFVGVQWAIFGGESGKDAKRCNVRHIREGLESCEANRVKAFVKQMGSNVHDETLAHPDLSDLAVSTALAQGLLKMELRDSHGGDWSEWADDLRVREMPI
jgi:protein gp37